ncbi:hypothetical protein TWF481_009015 [Arthrobotrys musiformis]|uniref:Uncharacterized protein n=1 Tax=Arthrobotrys musiformis TaxID=47236 RepID=A0AAV9W2C9_9PEZI
MVNHNHDVNPQLGIEPLSGGYWGDYSSPESVTLVRPCVYVSPLEWKRAVCEGARTTYTTSSRPGPNSAPDIATLPFRTGLHPETWTSPHHTLETEYFDLSIAKRRDPLWGCVADLVIGCYGVRRRLSKDYRRCRIRNTTASSQGGTEVILYDLVVSPTDGVIIIYGSNRPQDNFRVPVGRKLRTDYVGAPSGGPSQPVPAWTWGDMVYSIWYSQVFFRNHLWIRDARENGPNRKRKRSPTRCELCPTQCAIDSAQQTQAGPSSRAQQSASIGSLPPTPVSHYSVYFPVRVPPPRFDRLNHIVFRGLDSVEALDFIRECYNQLNYSLELDTLASEEVNRRQIETGRQVRAVLRAVPGVYDVCNMVYEHMKQLGHRSVRDIVVKWSKVQNNSEERLPSVMLVLQDNIMVR